MKVTNQLRHIRRSRSNLSQEELAEKVGCTRQTIIALEQGRYNPSLLLAMRIVKVFDLTVEDIFILEEK